VTRERPHYNKNNKELKMDFVLDYLMYGAIMFVVTWLIYVPIMWLKNNIDDIPKIFHWPIKIVAYPVAAVGFVLDVVFNIIFGTVMFLQWPDFKDPHVRFMPTLSERLRDIIKCRTAIEPDSFRFAMAMFICKYLLEPFDYGHCALAEVIGDRL
jgi:hypothetical protein